jgi:hypothetical protein
VTVDSDRAGELHVHSSPEQVLAFPAGRSTQDLVIDAPGSVQVEDHESEVVVAIIEVS